jgi:hypothetical protein
MKRTTAYLAASLTGGLLLVVVMLVMLGSSRDRLASLVEAEDRMSVFRAEHESLSKGLRRLEGKKNLTAIKGLVQAVDEVFEPLGLKEKVKSVKVIPTREENMESAEVTVHGTDTNETINFLYVLENTPMPLSIKKIILRTSFDQPELLNITMTLSYIKS